MVQAEEANDNTREVQARKVQDYDHCEKTGDFFLTPPNKHEGGARRLSFICPCGCGELAGIRVRDDGHNIDGAWGWDKNEDQPTCTPSIRIDGEHWHGHLTAGVFVPC